MDKYRETLKVLKRCGSVAGAAKELGCTPKTVRNRIKRFKTEAGEFIYPEVRGRNSGCYRTLSDGSKFYFATPVGAQVKIDDLARGLSRISWNSGQTDVFYSLAWVSTEFSKFVSAQTGDLRLAKLALFHYAHTAYIGYIPWEVERSLTGNYRVFKRKIREAVYDAFMLLYYQMINEHKIKELEDRFEHLLITHIGKDSSVFDVKVSSPRLDENAFLTYWTSLAVVEEAVKDGTTDA